MRSAIPLHWGHLWGNALVLYGISLAHGIKFYTPFPSIVSKYEFRNPIPTNKIIFQKPCNSLGSMISYCLGFTPLRIVVDGHKDIFIA
jgi:hypothetical protein